MKTPRNREGLKRTPVNKRNLGLKKQPRKNKRVVYPDQFYKVKEGDMTMDITHAANAVKGKKLVRWTVEDEDLVKNLNLGSLEDLELVKITKNLGECEVKVKNLLLRFKDVFAFTYKGMKGIPRMFANTRSNYSRKPSRYDKCNTK